eukprot:CAMPEP_0181481668 /NCGR_PEP_ID=MMETSP1110-20121109/44433_1 /TAXON_ID=174948 /ORGANISM="Symbiodinium sp., Strain CCMP421" /LENGTH=81 /DNA_ID=CAMNT_0023607173 /DNA_START=74 /DNA_END=316 /DNA_ORIENTATION=+
MAWRLNLSPVQRVREEALDLDDAAHSQQREDGEEVHIQRQPGFDVIGGNHRGDVVDLVAGAGAQLDLRLVPVVGLHDDTGR